MTPNAEEKLLADMQVLKDKLEALHISHSVTSNRYGWLKILIHDLEYNPQTQYKVHITATWFWVVNLPIIVGFFVLFPDQWLSYGVFITLLYSLYANLATDYGAASAALAAMGNTPLPEIPGEVHKGA